MQLTAFGHNADLTVLKVERHIGSRPRRLGGRERHVSKPGRARALGAV